MFYSSKIVADFSLWFLLQSRESRHIVINWEGVWYFEE